MCGQPESWVVESMHGFFSLGGFFPFFSSNLAPKTSEVGVRNFQKVFLP